MKVQSSLLMLNLYFVCLPLLSAQEMDKPDSMDYLDEHGKQHKITNVQEEFFYNRIHTAKLEGSTEATVYWINLYVGYPPQRQSAIIDTGSSRLAFPCSQCHKNCGKHINLQYDLNSSLTAGLMSCNGEFKKFKCSNCDTSMKACSWSVDYAEGSNISGFIATDFIVFGDEMQAYIEEQRSIDKEKGSSQKESPTELLENEEYLKFMAHEGVKLPFGCTTRENNIFLTQQPDGVLGLGPQSNSDIQPPNLIDQVFEKHKQNNEQLVFSLCLNWKEGGYMSIGGYNHELHLPDAETTIIPYSSDEGFFKVTLKSVKIDNQTIIDKIQPSIIDSGTTLVYGPASFVDPLIEELNNQCNHNQVKYKCGGTKNYFSSDQRTFQFIQNAEFPTEQDFLDSFPVFNFEFEGGSVIQWKAHGYLYPNYNKHQGLFSLGIEVYPSQNVYLSGPFLKNMDVLFDRQKNNIHFTPSECSLPNINSVLMNLHSHKIRKTQKDTEFIKQLEEFRKHHNITFPDLEPTPPTKKYQPIKKIGEDAEKNPRQREQHEAPDSIIFYIAAGVVGFIFLLMIVCIVKSAKRPIDSVQPVRLQEEATAQELHEINLKQEKQQQQSQTLSYQQQQQSQVQSEIKIEDRQSQRPSEAQIDVHQDLEKQSDQ